MKLKTYGMDTYSNMGHTALSKIVSKKDLDEIKCELNDYLLETKALRWKARGLSVEYTVRKVKVDMEIQSNKGW